MAPAGDACRLGHHAAPIALVAVTPAQGHASTTASARYQHPQRAGLCQATQAAAIAGRALGWLGRCRRLQPHDGRRRLGHAKATPERAGVKETMGMEGEGIRAASGDAAAAPDHAPRKGAATAPNAKKKDPSYCGNSWGEEAGQKGGEKNRPEGDKRQERQGRCPTPRRSAVGTLGPKPDQQPLGRPVRMGTMPLTLSVAPEPSLAVRVLLVKRTRSLSRSTAESTASPLAYSLPANVMNTW